MVTQPTYEISTDWVLLVDNVDYLAQVLSENPAEVILHTSNSTPPTDSAEGHVLEQGEAINLPGILWARGFSIPDSVQRTRVKVSI